MNKRWVFVALLLGALAVGITGGTVLAQDSGASGSGSVKTFASRMAAILGLDQAKVQDAMNQAAREAQNDALLQRLDSMVQAGRLTQQQADEYKGWYQSRPESLSPGFDMHGFGGGMGGIMGGGRGHRGGMGFHHGYDGDAPTAKTTGATSSYS